MDYKYIVIMGSSPYAESYVVRTFTNYEDINVFVLTHLRSTLDNLKNGELENILETFPIDPNPDDVKMLSSIIEVLSHAGTIENIEDIRKVLAFINEKLKHNKGRSVSIKTITEEEYKSDSRFSRAIYIPKEKRRKNIKG